VAKRKKKGIRVKDGNDVERRMKMSMEAGSGNGGKGERKSLNQPDVKRLSGVTSSSFPCLPIERGPSTATHEAEIWEK